MSEQKTCFVASNTCLIYVTTKLFLATQMILAAAPANDREERERGEGSKIGARDMGKKEGGEEDRGERETGGGGGREK